MRRRQLSFLFRVKEAGQIARPPSFRENACGLDLSQAKNHDAGRSEFRIWREAAVRIENVPAGIGNVVEGVSDDDAVGGVVEGGRSLLDDLLRNDLGEGWVELQPDDALGTGPILRENERAACEVEAIDRVQSGFEFVAVVEPGDVVGGEVEQADAAYVVGHECAMAVGQRGRRLRRDEVVSVNLDQSIALEAVDSAAIAVAHDGITGRG